MSGDCETKAVKEIRRGRKWRYKLGYGIAKRCRHTRLGLNIKKT